MSKKAIPLQKMFDDNVENIKDIKEIIEMHTLCIKKLTENQKNIERKLTEMYDMVNKIMEKK